MSVAAMLALGLVLAGEAKSDAVPDKPYAVVTEGTTPMVKANGKGVLKLQIKPADGFKISREAPLKIQLASEGLELAKDKLGQKDADDEKSTSPRFAVSFSAAKAGQQAIDAKATFFVCNETLCERKTEQVTVAVKVEP